LGSVSVVSAEAVFAVRVTDPPPVPLIDTGMLNHRPIAAGRNRH
jgi:hypothetical protein